jgi:uncharacterized protein YegP (UPF0339 family)
MPGAATARSIPSRSGRIAQNGIESVKANAPTAQVDDLT